jgi:hypothetical protein
MLICDKFQQWHELDILSIISDASNYFSNSVTIVDGLLKGLEAE